MTLLRRADRPPAGGFAADCPQLFPYTAPPLTPAIGTSAAIIAPGSLDGNTVPLETLAHEFLRRRNDNTRRAYRGDLIRFFAWAEGRELAAVRGRTTLPTTAEVQGFLGLGVPEMAYCLDQHKSYLVDMGQKEATVNRRFAAIVAFVRFAHRMGKCAHDGSNLVDLEKVQGYRDTRGIDVEAMKKLLKAPAAALKAKRSRRPAAGEADAAAEAQRHDAARQRVAQLIMLRDTAILHLLCENGLRRVEVHKLSVADFSFRQRRIAILGKGRGAQQEYRTITERTAKAIGEYLLTAGHATELTAPLFRNVAHDPSKAGLRLTGQAIYYLVGQYGKQIGLERLTPHMLRHGGVTALLDETSGDVRSVQKWSRHRKADTLLIYDDNRQDIAGELTTRLSKLLG